MGATYSWHQGTGCVNPRWTVPVPLLPDEIISSWLVRAALVQGCDPLVLTGEVWPKWRMWTLDVDRAIPDERLTALSSLSGISREAFRLAVLHPFANRIYGGQPTMNAVWPWILAIGARNTKRRGGLQYCPMCLSEDNTPYYRLQWRFSWHTGCEIHNCSLLDRCWNCGAPLEPHRLIAEDKYVTVCATCKADIRNAEICFCPAGAQSFQRESDLVLRECQGVFLEESVTVREWFEMADFFASIIRRANRSGTKGLMDLMVYMGVTLPEGLSSTAGSGVELLRVHERQKIFEAIWPFVASNRRHLDVALKKSGISRQGFCSKDEILPAVLEEMVENLPDNKPVARTRKPRVAMGSPRPRYVVMRMMKRLERKLQMLRR